MPVQKDKGWEFTDLSKFDPDGWEQPGEGDLDAQPARDAMVAADGAGVLQVDGTADAPRAMRPTASWSARSARPSPSMPRWSSPTSARSSSDRDKFAAQNTATLARRPVRARARRRRGRGPDRRLGDPGDDRRAARGAR